MKTFVIDLYRVGFLEDMAARLVQHGKKLNAGVIVIEAGDANIAAEIICRTLIPLFEEEVSKPYIERLEVNDGKER